MPDDVGHPFKVPHHRSIILGMPNFNFPSGKTPSPARIILIRNLISHYKLDRVSRAIRESQAIDERKPDSRILVDVYNSTEKICSYSPNPQLYIILDANLFAFYIPSSRICTFFIFRPDTYSMSETEDIILTPRFSQARLTRWEKGIMFNNCWNMGQNILKKAIDRINRIFKNTSFRVNPSNRGYLHRSPFCKDTVYFQMGFVPFRFHEDDIELVEFTCVRWILRNVVRINRSAFQEFYTIPIRIPITIMDLDDSVHFIGFCKYHKLSLATIQQAYDKGCFYIHHDIITLSNGDYCRFCKEPVLDTDSFRHHAMLCSARVFTGEIITQYAASKLPKAYKGGFELPFDS